MVSLYRVIQPPIFPDEQREPVQLYSNAGCGLSLGFIPRSTHINLHPLTHVIVVAPPGASTTNSNAGGSLCA
jgi:hypothetical protein